MANYLMKYKGRWRILPEIDNNTQDFPKNPDGSIDEDMIYISCQNGNKIWYYGLSDNRRAILGAYIPSLVRGHNIKKAMEKDNIEFFDYDESDIEVTFRFKAEDIDVVATLLKARTTGANTSPFSSKNLPVNKDVKIPDEDMQSYKKIVDRVNSNDVLKIKSWNSDFLNDVLQKKIRKDTKNKKYDVKEDMKQSQLSRKTKEFIYMRGMWSDYLKYLDNAIEEYYNNK